MSDEYLNSVIIRKLTRFENSRYINKLETAQDIVAIVREHDMTRPPVRRMRSFGMMAPEKDAPAKPSTETPE